jgi:hypothetical protein
MYSPSTLVLLADVACFSCVSRSHARQDVCNSLCVFIGESGQNLVVRRTLENFIPDVQRRMYANPESWNNDIADVGSGGR